MNRWLSIQNKLLLLGLVPLGLISILFIYTLSGLESHSLGLLLAEDREASRRVWEQLVKEEGRFLEFSGLLIRQDPHLLQALKRADAEAIARHTDHVWNQISERVELLFFWNGSEPWRRLLHWIARNPEPPDLSQSTPLLEQVATTRRAAFGLARFHDGKLRLIYAAAYFTAPGQPCNLAVQGVGLEHLAERLQPLIGASGVRVVALSPGEPDPSRIIPDESLALFSLPLLGVDGVAIGHLEIRKDLSLLMNGFTLAKRAVLVAPGVLILLTSVGVWLFVRWLIRRLAGIQNQLSTMAHGRIEPLPRPHRPDELDQIADDLYQQGRRLEETHRQLEQARKQHTMEVESRLTLNQLLETSLALMPLTQQLETLLDIIFCDALVCPRPQGSDLSDRSGHQ